jgi:hypothetical protein
MPKVCYISKAFNEKHAAVVHHANVILEEYQRQGFTLTLRQLYYQFVARGLLANSQSMYKWLGDILGDARLAGEVDWYHLEDRTRNLKGNSHWKSPAELVSHTASSFKMDKWADQPYKVEVWIEKDALLGVLDSICPKLDVDYFSCRGYTSLSEIWKAGQRLKRAAESGKKVVILHFGDHDPSGMDMSRDILSRVRMFMDNQGQSIQVLRCALNMAQVKRLNPVPNPAKLTDSRAKRYIAEYGSSSWELDALEPAELVRLVTAGVVHFRDDKLWHAATAREQTGRDQLARVAELMAAGKIN